MEYSAEKNEQIAFLVEIIGGSIENARRFLQATNWKVDEAVQLFYAIPELYYSIPNRDERSIAQPASSPSDWYKSNAKLEALYSPPSELMFKGSFEQAKSEAARQGKWLIANIQSPTEFSSYMLNKDTWANQGVKEIIGASFIFWQIYDDNEEGRKVCTYYGLTENPSTLVIDSFTGQKIQAWTGEINPERLLEDLIRLIENDPTQYSHSIRARADEARGKALDIEETTNKT